MGDLANGFWIQNATGVLGHTAAALRIEAYDANKQRIGGPTDAILYNNGMRFVSADNIGSADHVYILAFYDSPNYNPPPGIGIISGTHGEGGGAGFSISILGTGFGASASGAVTVTEAFSQPSMVAKMELKKYWGEKQLGGFPNPACLSAITIVSMLNEAGDDILMPIFVKDFLTGEMEGPPGWDKRWEWGWSPPLVKS